MAAPAANQSSTVVADTAVLFLGRCPIAHLRVATYCSGIDVPMAVFEELDIATDHVFSSECNQTLREFIAENLQYMKSRYNHIPCPEETGSGRHGVTWHGVTWGD